MVVVPYDWVKVLLRHPPEMQKKLEENQMTRAFNLRFPDDFGKPASDTGGKASHTPAKTSKSASETLIKREPTNMTTAGVQTDSIPKADQMIQTDPISQVDQAIQTDTMDEEVPVVNVDGKEHPHTQFSEPYADLKQKLHVLNVISKDGHVISAKGLPNIRSDIDEILAYLSGKRKRAPAGSALIKQKLKQNKLTAAGLQLGSAGRPWTRI